MINRTVIRRSQAPAIGANDVLDGETMYRNVPAPSVLITSQAELAELSQYPAGTVAYTAGFKAMWQLSAAGEWVSVL